jgi:hypothetical protein
MYRMTNIRKSVLKAIKWPLKKHSQKNAEYQVVEPKNLQPYLNRVPAYGTRRSDGKIFFKNEGWQTENWIEMQINNNNSTIVSYQRKIGRLKPGEDNFQIEAAKDIIKYLSRRNRQLEENLKSISKVNVQDGMKASDDVSKRLTDFSVILDKGYPPTNSLPYKTDMILTYFNGSLPRTMEKLPQTLKLAEKTKAAADFCLSPSEINVNSKNPNRLISGQGVVYIPENITGENFGSDKLSGSESGNNLLQILAELKEIGRYL